MDGDDTRRNCTPSIHSGSADQGWTSDESGGELLACVRERLSHSCVAVIDPQVFISSLCDYSTPYALSEEGPSSASP